MYVYILTNPGKSVFYTGVTNNLKRRIQEHKDNKGKSKTFAGKYYCNKLVYFEEIESIIGAIKREKEIKRFNRKDKIALVKMKNPMMHTIIP
jgi:putative endonuclease